MHREPNIINTGADGQVVTIEGLSVYLHQILRAVLKYGANYNILVSFHEVDHVTKCTYSYNVFKDIYIQGHIYLSSETVG